MTGLRCVTVWVRPNVFDELTAEAGRLGIVHDDRGMARSATVSDVVTYAVEYVLDLKAEARYSDPIGARSWE